MAINTEETGEDSLLWLKITSDMLTRKVKAEIASSYTVIFRDTESGMSFWNTERLDTILLMEMRN